MNTRRARTKRIVLLTALTVLLLLVNGLPVLGPFQQLGGGTAHAAPITWDIAGGDLVIGAGGEYAVTGATTSHTIIINTPNPVTITLDHVSIDVSAISNKCAFDSGGNVTLFLIGSNSLKSGADQPGIRVTGGEQLTVSSAPSSDGALSANGGSAGAGIGGGKAEDGGAVAITGGAVTATGGVTGAGIGGGSGGTGGSVTISDGALTAISSGWAAGIGGGYLKDGGVVTIIGGTVRVVGGDYSAGIGGAYGGDGGGPITITGGAITVNGGVFGAGIGGGYGGDGGNVVITGGSIKAYGGSAGKNIGAGNLGANSGTLTNGFVTVALRTIPDAVTAVNPVAVTYAIPVSGSNPDFSYVYAYTGAGHGGGDTNLYFYLPPGGLPGPTGLKAVAVSSSQVNLSWIDNDADEQGFQIERCTGVSCNGFAPLATVGANVTGYADTGLTPSTGYSYRVRSSRPSGESGYSNTASSWTYAATATPNAPSKLTATVVSKSQVDLTWTDNADGETGFYIERCKDAGCTNFSRIASVGANATRYSNTKLATNTTYRYRVSAFNASSVSGYSNIVQARTLQR